MTPFQVVILLGLFPLLIADVYYTRKWINEMRKGIEEHRRALRSMGYTDPREDDPE
jgi:hypothetical protein